MGELKNKDMEKEVENKKTGNRNLLKNVGADKERTKIEEKERRERVGREGKLKDE
jgi:hypothetical protein